jgi:hypothetical protein
VKLPGWQYPIVIDTVTGDIRYNNFNGHWGDASQLDKLLQAYAAEKVRAEARPCRRQEEVPERRRATKETETARALHDRR